MLGTLPTQETIVAERFFDESGGMQLVIHAPFGSRVNRAWGLALRKRFCRQFNFELQAAATEDGILLSLGPQHSFPLENVFRFLQPETVAEILVQALLDAPMFGTHWRWNATIALAIARSRGGRKVPPQIQRMEADDLLAAAFPDAAACLENIPGDREIPDHPLVRQTVDDCLHEVMDLDRLTERARGDPFRCHPASSPATFPSRRRSPPRSSTRGPTRSWTTRRWRSAARRRSTPAARSSPRRPTTSARSTPPRSRGCGTRPGPTCGTPTSCTTRCSRRASSPRPRACGPRRHIVDAAVRRAARRRTARAR